VAPPASKAHVAKFRSWLVDRVKESGWVAYAGEDLESISQRLGIRPEIITEARNVLADEYRKSGKLPWDVRPRNKLDPVRSRYEIVLPKVVHEDWKKYCESRELTQAAMLRSLIHYVLCRPDSPTWLSDHWRYHGRVHRICNVRGGKHGKGRFITSVQTDLTPGANEALKMRARDASVEASGLVRGAIIDLLEGRIKKLPVVHSRQMWDDPARYWRKGRQ